MVIEHSPSSAAACPCQRFGVVLAKRRISFSLPVGDPENPFREGGGVVCGGM